MTGSLCGGVIDETTFFRQPETYAMSYVMPDWAYVAYLQAKRCGDDLEASRLFQEWAWSAI